MMERAKYELSIPCQLLLVSNSRFGLASLRRKIASKVHCLGRVDSMQATPGYAPEKAVVSLTVSLVVSIEDLFYIFSF